MVGSIVRIVLVIQGGTGQSVAHSSGRSADFPDSTLETDGAANRKVFLTVNHNERGDILQSLSSAVGHFTLVHVLNIRQLAVVEQLGVASSIVWFRKA